MKSIGRALCAWGLLTVLAGCAGGAGGVPGSGDGELIVDFEGALRASQSYPSVGGTLRAVASLGNTAVFVTMRGGHPGAVNPWRLQSGRCGSGGAVVATAEQLPPIKPDQGGSDRVTATIPLQLSPDRDYHASVHLSPERMDVLVACGDLTN